MAAYATGIPYKRDEAGIEKGALEDQFCDKTAPKRTMMKRLNNIHVKKRRYCLRLVLNGFWVAMAKW